MIKEKTVRIYIKGGDGPETKIDYRYTFPVYVYQTWVDETGRTRSHTDEFKTLEEAEAWVRWAC